MDYKKDYYNILGVDNNATSEALRDAYRRLAKLHHPDKNPGDPAAEERIKAINEAYEILSNEITRDIYDGYRAQNKKEGHSQPANENNNTGYTYKPFATTKTRTYKFKRDKKVYVHGFIEAKFQGNPELYNTYLIQKEQRFTIIPTEVLVTIISSAIYKDRPPEEFQPGYSSAELFATPLKQPVNCRILTGDHEEYYQLELYEIRVKDLSLKDITRHDNYSFGTLQGTLFGFILKQEEDEVTEEYTEYSGPTGQVETKTEAGYSYSRQQFYSADGSTFWAEWNRHPNYARPRHRQTVSVDTNRWADAFWLVVFFILIAIWPKLLIVALVLVAISLLLFLFGWIISAFGRILPWLGGMGIALFVFFAVRSLFDQSGGSVVRTNSRRGIDSVSSERTVVNRENKQRDTIIRHNLLWEDRDSSRYQIQLSISATALRHSVAAHNQMDYQQYAFQNISAVYHDMLQTDRDLLQPAANAFDSIARTRSLDAYHRASMVISCIQSIPYALVVDGSCSDNYNSDFVRQYLSQCAKDCCKAYSKFGVQSPVEFLGDLKGDCDTRALILYELLRKLGYKVALMTSNYYKHAVVAVSLDEVLPDEAVAVHVNGEPYYLWETTSKGFGPGELPPNLSNINHWEIALIQ
jgi:curved DNA-binding protein CbpA